MIYFFIMVAFGVSLGGFIAQHSSIGLIGLVVALLLICCGLISSYLKNNVQSKQNFSSSQKNQSYLSDRVKAFDFLRRMEKIKTNLGETEEFSVAEMAFGLVNLADAKNFLTEDEYYYVKIIYNAFQKKQEKHILNFFTFIAAGDQMIAHFDLVAPFYKYSGSDDPQAGAIIDYKKSSYRLKAHQLIDDNKLFNEEWMILHAKFMEEFY